MKNGKVGIAGAGTMGGEIAYVLTQADFSVVMKDVDQKFLDIAIEKVQSIYSAKVKRRRMTEDEMRARIALLETTLDYGSFSDALLVIEAVPENLDLKRKVFGELEAACHGAVLASNTSALSISAIAEGVKAPEKVAGMHFFNPVSMMRLVEVIAGKNTSPETISLIRNVAEAAGKTPVTCADSAGFIVNRILCAAMMEAIRCEAEGLLSRDAIDRALVKPAGGLPVGLFRMADQLGIDLIFKVMTILENAFGERMRVPEIVKSLYSGGKLGLKTGSGFFEYAGETQPAAEPADEAAAALVVDRVLGRVVAEARRLAAEGAADEDSIDSAMRFGALFKRTPFALEAEIGKNNMDAKLNEYAAKYGPQFSWE